MQQDFQDFEIIVTDDSQSEAIQALCDSMESPLIRYRTNATNLGVALNLRAAIEEARGRYIAILNDDDAWESEFLGKLIAPLERNSHAVLAFSDHWIMSEDGSVDKQLSEQNSIDFGRSQLGAGKVDDIEILVLDPMVVPLAMAAIFRKSALDLTLLVKEVAGAYDFWIACLLVASQEPVYYVDQKLTRYRIHAVMETRRKAPDKNENMAFIFQQLIATNRFPTQNALLHRKHSQWLYQVGRDKLLFGQTRQARRYFLRSLRTSVNPKSIFSLLVSFLPEKLRVMLKFTR